MAKENLSPIPEQELLGLYSRTKEIVAFLPTEHLLLTPYKELMNTLALLLLEQYDVQISPEGNQ